MRNIGIIHKLPLYTLLILFLLAVGFPDSSAYAASCIKDTRDFQNAGGNTLKLRDYLCISGSDRIRVQFHRINDRTFESLRSNNIPSVLRPVFGDTTIIRNDVYAEWQTLIDSFGKEDPGASYQELTVFAAGGNSSAETLNSEIAPIKVLSTQQIDSPTISLPQDLSVIYSLAEYQKPSGYNQVSVHGTSLYWRYVTYDDLQNYPAYLRRWNEAILDQAGLAQRAGVADFYPENTDLELFKYIGARGWPGSFVPVVALFNACGGAWEFSIYEPLPLVDVALIENAGNSSVDITSILGSQSSNLALRPQRESRALTAAHARELAFNTGLLAPGERLLIPTRITFAVPDGLRASFEGTSGGPRLENYVYGPSFLVKGFVANGERVDLDEQSANFLALTTSCECGSCPYLYSWDDAENRWRRYGKVIHRAAGRSAQETETVSFEGLVSRYRLREEEAELAYIDEVSLNIELKDDSILVIRPGPELLAATDGRYAHILFGEALDMEFEIPETVDRTEVRKSHISITGYYRRYSEIMTIASRELPLLHLLRTPEN